MNTKRHRRLVFVLIKFDTLRTMKNKFDKKDCEGWNLENKTLKLYFSSTLKT